MYSILVSSAIIAFTLAAPHPQSVDISNAEAATALVLRHGALQKRDGDCSAQPVGPGPVASPDTVDGFYSLPALQSLANGAGTPSGYDKVFTNLQASVSASGYLGVYTLTSYDTFGCAARCNRASSCVAFNVYAERDPTKKPNASQCPNPPSTTNYFCTLWSTVLSASQATNKGRKIDSFQIAITASNAYNILAPTCTPVSALTNSNFETKNLSPWTLIQDPSWGWTSGQITSPGRSSSYAFAASLNPNPNHPNGFSSLILQQNLNTCQGRNYSISADVFFQYATPGQCELDIHIPYGGINNPSGVLYQAPNGGWSTTGTTFTAQSSSDLLQVIFTCNGGASNMMKVDNIVVLPYSGNA